MWVCVCVCVVCVYGSRNGGPQQQTRETEDNNNHNTIDRRALHVDYARATCNQSPTRPRESLKITVKTSPQTPANGLNPALRDWLTPTKSIKIPYNINKA